MPSPQPQKQTAREKRQQRRNARERFLQDKHIGRIFTRSLSRVAKQVGDIVEGYSVGGVVKDPMSLRLGLERYAEILKPWAQNVAAQMVGEVNQRNEKTWAQVGSDLGRNLRAEIAQTPTGELMRSLMNEQVALITSLPMKAAERVHKLVIEGQSDSSRAAEVAKEIARTGHVTKSRAMLIARTEIARTQNNLTQARAQYIGSEGYIWRTSEDRDVREIHRKLEGKFFRWDDPPVAGENGERAHAGTIYNCRCWAEPVIPDIVE